jgi:hypothetical protein
MKTSVVVDEQLFAQFRGFLAEAKRLGGVCEQEKHPDGHWGPVKLVMRLRPPAARQPRLPAAPLRATSSARPRERRDSGRDGPTRAGPDDARPPRPSLAVVAAIRHLLWVALPSANGDRHEIRADLERLTELLNGRDRWYVVGVIVDRHGHKTQIRDREIGGLYADKRAVGAARPPVVLDKPARKKCCSRCGELLTAENTSPGRAWCRPCEAKRRRVHRQRAKLGRGTVRADA